MFYTRQLIDLYRSSVLTRSPVKFSRTPCRTPERPKGCIFIFFRSSALVSDKQPLNASVTCLEVCRDFLFVDCKDGSVLRCCFKKNENYDIQSIMLSKATRSTIMNNYCVVQMKTLSILNQLLVLSDDTLSNLDFKKVCTFCFYENPFSEDPFTVEISISVRNEIPFVHLSDEMCKLVKEFSIQTTPIPVAMDGVHICFAVGLEYCMLDMLTGGIQLLFLRGTPEQIPLIRRVSKGEFLLYGHGVGMFVSTEGFSNKPPISFLSFVSALAHHHPYIIAVTNQGISFYSIMDQKSKQTIAISNVRCLVNGDGQIFLPISWEVQLEKLLLEDRLEKALQLASNAQISSSTKHRHQELLPLLEQKAALKRFSSGQFSEAMEIFETCNIDPREVIKLNLDDIFSEDENRCDQAKVFLLDFLQRWGVKSLSPDQNKVVDTALLRHLAAQDQQGIQLADLVTDCKADPEEVRSLLESHKKFHCLAVYCASLKEWGTALGIWERLVKRELSDPHFRGPAFMADQLTKSGDVSLICQFSGSILKIDQTVGCRILTELFRHSDTHAMKPTAVIEYLSDLPQSLKMLSSYLKFLVNEKKGEEVAAVQNQLATLYFEEIGRSDAQRNSPGQRLTVNKLRSLLRTAHMLVRAKFSVINQTPRFPHEYAIVCGRLGHRSAAIKIFIEQLQDFDAAEEYCSNVDDPKAWNRLLTACVSRETQGSTFDRMIDLLRRRPIQFHVALPSSACRSRLATL